MPDTPHNTPNEHQNNQPHPRAHLETSWSPVADAMRHDLNTPTTRQGNPIDPADPGSPISRILALIFTIAVVATVILWQNAGDDWKYKYLLHNTPPETEITADTPAPGNFGQIDLVGRFYLRGYPLFKSQPVMSFVDNGSVAFTAEDQIRIAILAGEFENEDIALEKLDALESQLEGKRLDPMNPQEPDGLILAEIASLRAIYTVGPDALEESQRLQLIDRYSLMGRFALTHGLPDTDPLRAKLTATSTGIIIFGVIAMLGIIVVPLAGLALFVLGIVFFFSGKLKRRNHVPAKGGSVFLETYALFVASFIVMSVAAFFIANSSHPELASLSLVVQWVLLLTVFWGVVRGMPMKSWRKAIGWHAGEGVFKEIGIGIITYIAAIPLYIVGIIITFTLMLIKEKLAAGNATGPIEPEAISNPILEMIAHGDLATILMLFVLATTWAPIVEEAIFRGALFRHLRASMHWFLAALLSAFLFAFMHDYGPLLVAPLIALGFMFAFMREWRGSLIAPMTAHFLHNFTLMSFMIILVQLIKDPM
ncbi:MAG: CPBP family intramembrane glutamic endopeptidase [Phycisphaerales bacterium]